MTSRSISLFHLGSGHRPQCLSAQLHKCHDYHKPDLDAETHEWEQYSELHSGKKEKGSKRPREQLIILTEDKRALLKAVRILKLMLFLFHTWGKILR